MSWSPRKNISAYASPASVTAIISARAGGRACQGRFSPAGSDSGADSGADCAPDAVPDSVLEELDPTITEAADADGSPAEAAGREAAPAEAVGPADPGSAAGREDDADSSGRAASPVRPVRPVAPSAAPGAFACSSSFIQRPRRFSRMRIDTSMGVPLKPKVSRRRRMMNRR